MSQGVLWAGSFGRGVEKGRHGVEHGRRGREGMIVGRIIEGDVEGSKRR